jgi:hypothetical protein
MISVRLNTDITKIMLHHTNTQSGIVGKEVNNIFIKNQQFGAPYDILINYDGKIDLTARWMFGSNSNNYSENVSINTLAKRFTRHHLSDAGDTYYSNLHYVHIALVGNFDIIKPSSFQLNSLQQVLAFLKKDIPTITDIIYHDDESSTTCPGIMFFEKDSIGSSDSYRKEYLPIDPVRLIPEKPFEYHNVQNPNIGLEKLLIKKIVDIKSIKIPKLKKIIDIKSIGRPKIKILGKISTDNKASFSVIPHVTEESYDPQETWNTLIASEGRCVVSDGTYGYFSYGGSIRKVDVNGDIIATWATGIYSILSMAIGNNEIWFVGYDNSVDFDLAFGKITFAGVPSIYTANIPANLNYNLQYGSLGCDGTDCWFAGGDTTKGYGVIYKVSPSGVFTWFLDFPGTFDLYDFIYDGTHMWCDFYDMYKITIDGSVIDTIVFSGPLYVLGACDGGDYIWVTMSNYDVPISDSFIRINKSTLAMQSYPAFAVELTYAAVASDNTGAFSIEYTLNTNNFKVLGITPEGVTAEYTHSLPPAGGDSYYEAYKIIYKGSHLWVSYYKQIPG